VIRAEAGPLAVNPQDRSNGRVAWLVIQRECDEPASALHINTKILEYNGLTMLKDVGVTEATVTDFNRLIVKKNSDLPLANRFSDDSMTEKLLGAIITPPTLAQVADSLLQCPPGNRDATDEIDPLDIFGEPMHATEGAQEVYGWPFPAPANSPMRRAVVACTGIALVGVLASEGAIGGSSALVGRCPPSTKVTLPPSGRTR
jgi:hypothetical protein